MTLMKNRLASTRAGIIAMMVAIAGCAVARAPIAHTPNVVATPEQGRVAVSVAAAPTVGEVTPVYASVANGTDAPRSLIPSQIFALNDAGQRVAPLPPGEAARQAGGANELEGAVKSAADQRRWRRCRRCRCRRYRRCGGTFRRMVGFRLTWSRRVGRYRVRSCLAVFSAALRKDSRKPISRPTSSSKRSRSSPKKCARTSLSAATSIFPKAHTTRSRCF